MNHDIEKLARDIEALHHSLERLAGGDEWKELFKLIHFPGYTTPAEFFLITHVVTAMSEQAKILTQLKQSLVEGSHLIINEKNQAL